MRRILIFVHFDRHNIIDPYCQRLFRSLRDVCCYRIFVSSTKLSDADIAWAKENADQVVIRDNIGYDFMSYKCGLELAMREFGQNCFDEIIFCNDSFYGPIGDIQQCFLQSETFDAPIWGASISNEISRHIQSYLFGVRGELLQKPVFERFWMEVEPLSDKRQIIKQYEIGMSERLIEARIPIAGIFDTEREPQTKLFRSLLHTIRPLSRPRRAITCFSTIRALNPTQFYAGYMLKNGFPFVKVELLRDNPLRLDLADIWRMIAKSPENYELIMTHLQRMAARCTDVPN